MEKHLMEKRSIEPSFKEKHLLKKLCVVIPMKAPQRAKQRLASRLSDSSREKLALNLFESTLVFFNREFASLDVLVVSDSEEILTLAQQHGAFCLFDQGDAGLNGALDSACCWVTAFGYAHQLIIPSDIAWLDSQEIHCLLRAAGDSDVVIAEAKDGGTNALLTTPPNAIGFHYGVRSALSHHQQATRQALRCCCLQLPHLSLDIDQSDDLALATQQQPTRFNAWRVVSTSKEPSYV